MTTMGLMMKTELTHGIECLKHLPDERLIPFMETRTLAYRETWNKVSTFSTLWNQVVCARALLQIIIPSPTSSCSSRTGQIPTLGSRQALGRLGGLLGLCFTRTDELPRWSLRPLRGGEVVVGALDDSGIGKTWSCDPR